VDHAPPDRQLADESSCAAAGHYIDAGPSDAELSEGVVEELADTGLRALAEQEPVGIAAGQSYPGREHPIRSRRVGSSCPCPIPSSPSQLGLGAGRAVSQHLTSAHRSLLVRSPGAHLHPLLRRVSVADHDGEGRS
jgi:hypothetical protein